MLCFRGSGFQSKCCRLVVVIVRFEICIDTYSKRLLDYCFARGNNIFLARQVIGIRVTDLIKILCIVSTSVCVVTR